MRLSTGERIQEGPTLSLAMIVKNEAEHLETCLSTARPHVDEIVVIDTGSTDGTQAIAKQYADVFDEIEWPDSFSIARNYSMDKASGDYILILDGDEHIGDEKHWNGIRRILREVEKVATVELYVRNIVPDNQILKADCVYQTRIVKNHPKIRYEGKVHNQIRRNSDAYREKTGTRNVRTNAEVFHVGYSYEKEKLQKKYSERLHLLQHEVENAPNAIRRAYYQYQLANAYFMLKKPDKVVATLDEMNYDHLVPMNAHFTRFMHGFACVSIDQHRAALGHAEAMLALSEAEPVGYMLAGEALKHLGQKEAALAMLIKAFDQNEEGRGQIRFELDEAYLCFLIALLAAQLGYLERAQFFATQYTNRYPDDETGNELLRRINKHLEKQKMPTS
jgi:glycosyltransferase involved in cell wall biosynthesis